MRTSRVGAWRVRATGMAGAAVLGLLLCPAVRAADPASMVIVLDGSGSMWGTLEGVRVSKFAMARDAIRRGLAAVSPQTRVGLASFGHRRGDCGDVEVIRPAEP